MQMQRVNWQRGVYLALFFCNAVFATLFRSLGDGNSALYKVDYVFQCVRTTDVLISREDWL